MEMHKPSAAGSALQRLIVRGRNPRLGIHAAMPRIYKSRLIAMSLHVRFHVLLELLSPASAFDLGDLVTMNREDDGLFPGLTIAHVDIFHHDFSISAFRTDRRIHFTWKDPDES